MINQLILLYKVEHLIVLKSMQKNQCAVNTCPYRNQMKVAEKVSDSERRKFKKDNNSI